MYIKDLNDCEEIIAGDKTILREFLHPDKADLKLHYSLAHAIVRLGESSQKHKLKNSEVYYILEGQGVMHINGESQKVNAGLPGTFHQLLKQFMMMYTLDRTNGKGNRE